jgi:hypothetical protein
MGRRGPGATQKSWSYEKKVIGYFSPRNSQLRKFHLAQNVGKKKAEPKTPHFLSLNQDIVARSQEEKCGLKYVMHTPGGPVWTPNGNSEKERGGSTGLRPLLFFD